MVDVGILAQRFRDIDSNDWSNLLYILLVILLPALGKLGSWLRERSAQAGEKADGDSSADAPAKGVPPTARAVPSAATPSVPPAINRGETRPAGSGVPTDRPPGRGTVTVRGQRGDRRVNAAGELSPPAKRGSRPSRDRGAPRATRTDLPTIPIPDAMPVRPTAGSPTRPARRVQSSDAQEARLTDWHLSPGGQPVRQAAGALRTDPARGTPAAGTTTPPAGLAEGGASPALRRLLQRRDLGAIIVLNELLRPPLALREQDDRPHLF